MMLKRIIALTSHIGTKALHPCIQQADYVGLMKC